MNDLFMKWRPDFNLGLKEIDEQHKKIVELINTLNEAFMKNVAQQKLGQILDEMAAYADYHFKTEEALFTRNHFPFSKEHIAMHQHFKKKVEDFKDKFEKGQPITFRVLSFLRQWLTNHILDADREYAALVKSKEE
jgi:hemerythrin